jgi:hypothetical protein
MRFAKAVYWVAGIYGVLALLPMYFMERMIGREHPPAISHPEFFYGFIGLGLAWQIAFLLVAQDPAKYRVMMIPAMVEKATFGVAVIILYEQNRLAIPIFAGGMVDLLLLLLFFAAYRKTAPHL